MKKDTSSNHSSTAILAIAPKLGECNLGAPAKFEVRKKIFDKLDFPVPGHIWWIEYRILDFVEFPSCCKLTGLLRQEL